MADELEKPNVENIITHKTTNIVQLNFKEFQDKYKLKKNKKESLDTVLAPIDFSKSLSGS